MVYYSEKKNSEKKGIKYFRRQLCVSCLCVCVGGGGLKKKRKCVQETLYGERNDFNSYRIYTHINVYAICKLFIKRKLSQPFQTHIHWVTNESTKKCITIR